MRVSASPSCPAPPCCKARRTRSAPRRLCVRAAAEEETDLVTRWVGQIFGKKAINDPAPAGLARMTREEWPDQWPPVTDEFAALLEGDTGEVARLRPLLRQTQLEFQPLALAFDADVHGWYTSAFHTQLDGMGAAVLVLETRGGALCGGYNPKGWLGYGDWRDAISAFLFTWPDNDAALPALKLPKCGGSGMAIVDEQGGGPQFGPDGLKVNVGGRSARSRLGSYYARRPDGGRFLFADDEAGVAELTAMRVYVGVGTTAKAESYKPSMLQWQPGELESLRDGDQAA